MISSTLLHQTRHVRRLKSLAKTKELHSSLILLINSAWAAAKEFTTMKNEVKDIMYHLYQAKKSSLRSIAPCVLATAFSTGDEHALKELDALYTTPTELNKWIKIMLDAYHQAQSRQILF